MQKRHYTDINRYEQSSLKGEKKKIIWNAVFSQHNPIETEQLTEGLDEMNDSGAELWANTELRAGNSSAQEPHSVPISCQSSTAALSARETRDTRDRRMCSFSPNNPTRWHNKRRYTRTHSTLFLFPLGRSLLQLRVFLFLFLFSRAAQSLVSLNYRY